MATCEDLGLKVLQQSSQARSKWARLAREGHDTQFASIVVVCQNACSHECRTVLSFLHYRDNFRLTLASVFDTLTFLQ
jgi:hypothetical protein